MLDSKAINPTAEEIAYMTPRGLWKPFQNDWTPLQKALYLGQIRDHHGLPLSERAAALGVSDAEARREMEGLWGVLLWDSSEADPVPIHRD